MLSFIVYLTCHVLSALVVVAKFVQYWGLMRRRKTKAIQVDELPPAAVVLCVRGSDQQLKDCLKGLLTQDYFAYHVFIIVDNISDPAWSIVHEMIEQHPQANVTVQALENRRVTCSLKCSAILQALDLISEDYPYCAFLDSDVKPHPTWLGELISELRDDRVGLVFGCRWFMASHATHPNMFRYMFAMMSAVWADLFLTPWGGTLAAKTQCLQNAQVRERLSHSFVEDTIYFKAIRQQGMQVKLLPHLVMANRSESRSPQVYHWSVRQLLNTKLYHPLWPVMLFIVLWFVVLHVVGALFVARFLYEGRYDLVALLLSAGTAHLLTMTFCYAAVDRENCRVLADRGENISQSPGLLSRSFWGLLVSLYGMPGIMLATYRMRSVCWRGVNYRIRGPWNIERLDYSIHGRNETAPQQRIESAPVAAPTTVEPAIASQSVEAVN